VPFIHKRSCFGTSQEENHEEPANLGSPGRQPLNFRYWRQRAGIRVAMPVVDEERMRPGHQLWLVPVFSSMHEQLMVG